MASFYHSELEKLGATYKAAAQSDISQVKAAIAGASESSIIAVGTGGSFTVASLLCNLHEAYTGRVSRPATSLELICNPTLAASSPIFLISAEGKNPDIVESLQRARRHSARPIHVLTNRKDSPLMSSVGGLTGITVHVHEIAEKDGYLATNSLLLNATLVARAYSELAPQGQQIPAALTDLTLSGCTMNEWLASADVFVREAVSRRGVIVTYSPLLRPIAADLESKLSEAALLHCQVADLRSLAHGRHLWFAERLSECAVLAFVEPSLEQLWKKTSEILPAATPTLTMNLPGASPKDLLAGLVAEMNLVSRIADLSGKDVGRPDVPQFGRDLYYVDLSSLIPSPVEPTDRGEQSKFNALGARWPSRVRSGPMRRALDAFRTAIEQQAFRAIVFDYDGTLCGSTRDESPPPLAIVTHLLRLLDGKIEIGIASGRGQSVQEQLRLCLPEVAWERVHLGLYSGGWITDVRKSDRDQERTSEFLTHVERLVRRLQVLGVPVEKIRTTHPYQVSVRFREGLQTEGIWAVIADALRQAGLEVTQMVRSNHSVDILAPGVDKSHLITHLINRYRIAPNEVLVLGDQGAWPGNDYSLLDHKFSLSVDAASRRLDRGWKLAPPHKREVDATVWYLDRIKVHGDGRFSVALQSDAMEASR